MNKLEIVSVLPRLYFVKGRKNRYELLKEVKLGIDGKQYKKIDELISMGFLEQVHDNPPTFMIDRECRKRIWNFFRDTPIGGEIMRMVRDNAAVLE